jgi:hypothetical protein
MDQLLSVIGNTALNSINDLSKDELLLLEARLIGMRELPPSIDEFIESDYYIGASTDNGKAIYPKWRQFLRELFPDPLHTSNTVVSLSGCIGSGKSRISRLILAYDYLKLTYFDNLEYAGLDNHVSGKSVDILFEHRSGEKAYEELIDPFYTMIGNSPYFSSHQFNDYKTRFLADGERTNKALGKDIITGMFSECNFQNRDAIEPKVYEITSRLTARFLKLLPYIGHIILDSSCNDDGNFMDDYLATTTWEVKSARYAIWEIKDFLNMYFKLGTFKVYAGDAVHEPFVIDDDSQVDSTMDPDKIYECPKELEAEARSDTRRFLKEKVGITTTSTGVFITDKEKLRAAFTLNCYSPEIVVDFMNESDTIWGRLESVVKDIPMEKRLYVGVDLGIVDDRTGLTVAYFDDYKKMGDETVEPLIKVPIAVGISRLPGQETPIYKIIDFILMLNKVRDVSLVVTDQFQSTQLRQDCVRNKIRCVLSSVDRTTEPYNYLKRHIYLGLIELPDNRILRHELATIINTGKKIDHLPGNSKDISDSLANAVFNLYKDIKTAETISGRYNINAQLNIMDDLGWIDTSLEKTKYKNKIINNVFKSYINGNGS